MNEKPPSEMAQISLFVLLSPGCVCRRGTHIEKVEVTGTKVTLLPSLDCHEIRCVQLSGALCAIPSRVEPHRVRVHGCICSYMASSPHENARKLIFTAEQAV